MRAILKALQPFSQFGHEVVAGQAISDAMIRDWEKASPGIVATRLKGGWVEYASIQEPLTGDFDVETATKQKLHAYAVLHLNTELDMRQSVDTLREQVRALALKASDRQGNKIVKAENAELAASRPSVTKEVGEMTDDELTEKFTTEAKEAGHSGLALTEIVEGRIRHVMAGGDGSVVVPAERTFDDDAPRGAGSADGNGVSGTGDDET